MITKEQIEAKDFTYWRTREDAANVVTDDYLALGTRKKGFNNEYTIPLLLTYKENGDLVIKAYYNNPLFFGKHYILYSSVLDTPELDKAITNSKFIISKIDITRVKIDYP